MLDLNQRVTESKSVAFPLGECPMDLHLIFFNWKILAESLEITLDYLSKIMYITSESVSAL